MTDTKSDDKTKLAIERGKRVKVARTLANLTRKALMDRHNINVNTIQAWEAGINCLTEKGTRKLVDALQKEGLIISKDWLLFGDVEQPQEVASVNDYLNLGEDMRLLQEIEFFKRINPQTISTIVTDDYLHPHFFQGDYVGGVIHPMKRLHELNGAFCIVTTQDGRLLTRKIYSFESATKAVIGGINHLSKDKTAMIESVEVSSVALITRQWLVNRLSRIG
jgi:DNA-binding transcriptional regulator YiaG